MPYEPGEEIELIVEKSKRKFFANAMSWREQKAYSKTIKETVISEDGTKVDTDKLLAAILPRLVRTDPPIELTIENLENVVDGAIIWELHAAVNENLTHDDKKKLDSQP